MKNTNYKEISIAANQKVLLFSVTDGRASPMNYQDAYRIRGVDQESNVKEYTITSECVINEKLFRATITRQIKNKSKAKDGRKFTVF